jgi:hypothetical protein
MGNVTGHSTVETFTEGLVCCIPQWHVSQIDDLLLIREEAGVKPFAGSGIFHTAWFFCQQQHLKASPL